MSKDYEEKPVPKPPKSGEQTVGPVTQALIKARMLIAHPARWTRGAFARDSLDRSVRANNDDACKWCASGALRKTIQLDDFEPTNHVDRKCMDMLAAASREYMKANGVKPKANCITVVNDGSGHAATMWMYNRAIILAKGA